MSMVKVMVMLIYSSSTRPDDDHLYSNISTLRPSRSSFLQTNDPPDCCKHAVEVKETEGTMKLPGPTDTDEDSVRAQRLPRHR